PPATSWCTFSHPEPLLHKHHRLNQPSASGVNKLFFDFRSMNMKNLLIRAISVGTLSVLASQLVAAPLDVTLHKDPYCGCCVKYAEYLEDHGYNVTMIDHNNMAPV